MRKDLESFDLWRKIMHEHCIKFEVFVQLRNFLFCFNKRLINGCKSHCAFCYSAKKVNIIGRMLTYLCESMQNFYTFRTCLLPYITGMIWNLEVFQKYNTEFLRRYDFCHSFLSDAKRHCFSSHNAFSGMNQILLKTIYVQYKPVSQE